MTEDSTRTVARAVAISRAAYKYECSTKFSMSYVPGTWVRCLICRYTSPKCPFKLSHTACKDAFRRNPRSTPQLMSSKLYFFKRDWSSADEQAVEEVPIRNMVARLGIERGTLQALQKEAAVFCGMIVCFCRHLQWHELANVLYSFQVTHWSKRLVCPF